MASSKPVQPLGPAAVAAFTATVVVGWIAAWIISQRVFNTPAGIVITSVPFFFLLMAVEALLGRGRFSSAGEYDLSDSVSSIGAGAVQQLGIMMLPLGAKPLFRALQDRFAFFVLPADAWYTLPVAFIVYDLQYYLTHRFLHECNVGWSFHQVHHSSDHYNLSSALRQSVGQYLFALWSPAVNSLFLPFEAHFTASACNTTYQFWVHSVVVHRLPSLVEFLFSTPAHHRVHHDRRVHKNYGGILIVWDRLFGTFLDEQGLLEGNYERELYGVLSAPPTWNPLRIQFDHFLAVCRRAMRAPKMLILGPGYRPKLRSTVLPPLGPYSVRVRRKTVLSRLSAAYVTAHFTAIILASFYLLAIGPTLPYSHILLGSLACILSLVSLSTVFDAEYMAWVWEAARCALTLAACVFVLRRPAVVLSSPAWTILTAVAAFYTISLAALVFVPSVTHARVIHQPSTRHKVE